MSGASQVINALFSNQCSRQAVRMRGAATTFFLIYLWVMLPLISLLAWFAGSDWFIVALACAAFAGTATIATRASRDNLKTRLTVSAAMLAQWMMLIYAVASFQSGEFVLDAHMLFFVIMGALIAYVCPITILFATTVVFFHHFLFNFLAPTLIWPSDEAALAHFFVHCALAIATAASTILISLSFRELMSTSEAALAASDADKQAAVAANTERERASTEAATQRAALMRDFDIAFGDVVEAAAKGDFSRRIDAQFPDAALNKFALRMNTVLSTVDAGVHETGRVVASLAEGDLSASMTGEFDGAFRDLQRDVNGASQKFSELFATIARVSQSARISADDVASNATALASRTEQQASSLEQTTATMEEMSSSIKSNEHSTTEARSLTSNAVKHASSGGDVVSKAIEAMSQIEAGSSKIADIVSVIDSIAFQTNLLALNAAVEAARAGDAGKGFAVVASEVRALAQRSSEASKDIRELIETSAIQVSEGVRLVTETGDALKEIVISISQVEATIESISKVSVEQSTSAQEISSAVSHMDQMTQRNSSMAEGGAATAQVLLETTSELERAVDNFLSTGAAAASDRSGIDAPRAGMLGG